LVRYRHTVVTEHTAVAKRITKLSESANIKLGQVASEVLGRRGRLRLRALAAGATNAETLAEFAQGQLKNKKAELRRALTGSLTPLQSRTIPRAEPQKKGTATCTIKKRSSK
jgi:hypothetical protein